MPILVRQPALQSLCKVCSVDYCLVESIAAGLDQDPKPVVVDTNPTSLADVLRDVTRVGQALGMPAAAAKAVAALQARIDAAVATAAELQAAHPDGTPPSVLFCEWPEPVFCGGHWTPQLIHMAGGSHPLNPPQDGVGAPPSFVVTPDAIVASHPDVVIVAPCGYDLAETKKHLPSLVGQPWWGQLRAAREGNVWLVDGNQVRVLRVARYSASHLNAIQELACVGLLWNQPGGNCLGHMAASP